MWRTLVSTRNDWAAFVLRLALAVVIFPHGAQKLLGWFGGYGLSASLGFFTEQLGIPVLLAWVAILVEFLAPLALLAGALARLAALAIGVQMMVAALLVHVPHGFFLNWSGTQQGQGFEFHILAVGMAVAIVVLGAGALSVDRAVGRTQV